MKQASEKAEMLEGSELMTEIGRCCREGEAGRTVYCLFREVTDGDRFLIRVSTDSESEQGRVTGSLSAVALLFEKIAKGDVPPYILSEILEDYAKENALIFSNI